MSAYGEKFDVLAHRWSVIEGEHDKFHRELPACAGTGCTLRAAAEGLRTEMLEELEGWRDRLPTPEPLTARTFRPKAPIGQEAMATILDGSTAVRRHALAVVLNVLDAWVESAMENHDSAEHRNENSGDECWRSFAPADIRQMVNDAAQDMGVTKFEIAKMGKEDSR